LPKIAIAPKAAPEPRHMRVPCERTPRDPDERRLQRRFRFLN
jgi:hypothetical protein